MPLKYRYYSHGEMGAIWLPLPQSVIFKFRWHGHNTVNYLNKIRCSFKFLMTTSAINQKTYNMECLEYLHFTHKDH